MKIYKTKITLYDEIYFTHTFDNLSSAYQQLEYYIDWFYKYVNDFLVSKEHKNLIKKAMKDRQEFFTLRIECGTRLYLNTEEILSKAQKL